MLYGAAAGKEAVFLVPKTCDPILNCLSIAQLKQAPVLIHTGVQSVVSVERKQIDTHIEATKNITSW